MKKYLKRIKQRHENSAGTMETGDHFKNGANPKSQTSRRNVFNKNNMKTHLQLDPSGSHIYRIVGNLAVLALLLFTVCRASAQQRHPGEPEMVKVEGGTFVMGCTSEQRDNREDCDDNEKPAHKVTLSSFQIGKYEVTQAQWKAVMGTGIRQQRDKVGSDWRLYGEGDNYPMYYVSWDEAQEFISRLNKATGKSYRLPTEAEWEYAARGGARSKGYKYSGSNNLDEVAWFSDNSNEQTHPVGAKKANELGIHDMSGNVWEWCQDRYGDYSASSQQNPKGADSGSNRVSRGGAWNNNAFYCRVALRPSYSPGYRSNSLGFRVVLP